MKWESKKSEFRRGANNTVSMRVHTSGDYECRPTSGGRYEPLYKNRPIRSATTLAAAKVACQDHAADGAKKPVHEEPIKQFVANVPPKSGRYMSFKESELLVPIPGTVTFSDAPPEEVARLADDGNPHSDLDNTPGRYPADGQQIPPDREN